MYQALCTITQHHFKLTLTRQGASFTQNFSSRCLYLPCMLAQVPVLVYELMVYLLAGCMHAKLTKLASFKLFRWRWRTLGNLHYYFTLRVNS
jgi:hypothetical protein